MPTLARAIVATAFWATCWWFATFQLSLEFARRLNPQALHSRFFFIWTSVQSLGVAAVGACAGAAFVLTESWLRGRATRYSSMSGWRAVAVGAALGPAALLVDAVVDSVRADVAVPIDPSVIAFGVATGAGCGVLTFLLDRWLTRIYTPPRSLERPRHDLTLGRGPWRIRTRTVR